MANRSVTALAQEIVRIITPDDTADRAALLEFYRRECWRNDDKALAGVDGGHAKNDLQQLISGVRGTRWEIRSSKKRKPSDYLTYHLRTLERYGAIHREPEVVRVTDWVRLGRFAAGERVERAA